MSTLHQHFSRWPEIRRDEARVVEAAGIEPASESASPGAATCVVRYLILLTGAPADRLPHQPARLDLTYTHRADVQASLSDMAPPDSRQAKETGRVAAI